MEGPDGSRWLLIKAQRVNDQNTFFLGADEVTERMLEEWLIAVRTMKNALIEPPKPKLVIARGPVPRP